MPDLVQATPEEVPRVWPALRDLINDGIKRSYGRVTNEGLYEKAKTGEWDTHIILSDGNENGGEKQILAVFFTQIYIDEMDGRRVCCIRFFSGSRRKEWVWLVAALEAWAKQNGCHRLSFLARKGWAPELKDYDYRVTHFLLEKELTSRVADDAGRRQEKHGNEHADAA